MDKFCAITIVVSMLLSMGGMVKLLGFNKALMLYGQSVNIMSKTPIVAIFSFILIMGCWFGFAYWLGLTLTIYAMAFVTLLQIAVSIIGHNKLKTV